MRLSEIDMVVPFWRSRGTGATLGTMRAERVTLAARSRTTGDRSFLVMTGSVALRRRAVVLAGAACGAALVVQEALGPAPVVSGFLALLIVLYSAGAHGERRQGVASLIVLLAALTVYPVTEPSARAPADLVGNLAIFVGAWALGRLVRHHRQRERALDAAHAQLRATQERERASALVAERARIARELHDIVAHGVSVMVLQAGAARAVLDTSPRLARDPLLTVESTGRQALEELHRMLGLLRTDEAGPNGESLMPAPDLTRLLELAIGLGRSGLDTHLRTVGEPVGLPPALSHCAYRVVQEGLTNVLKHAGCARADVVVTYAASRLQVEVCNGGGARVSGAGQLPTSGVGLLGLHERVRLYGGTLRAGPAGAGWRLVAELPYEGARPGREVTR
jgi:signal transduction histidine kinase